MLTIHDYDWQELDKLIDYSLSIRDNVQPLNFVNPVLVNEKGILPYSAAEIDLRLKAISKWNPDILITGSNQGINCGALYKQGPFLEEFKRRGGFKKLQEKQTEAFNENKLKEQAEYESNIATVNAAEYARRSAVASESSAISAKWAWIIAGLALLFSIISFIISLNK